MIPSYLLFSLTLCVPAVLIIMRSSRRRLVLMSGVVAAPAGLLDSLFTPEYWDAGHVYGAGFSIEGVLFSFANGVFIAWIAFAPWRAVFIRFDPARAIGRSILIAIPAWLVFLLLWRNAIGLAELSIMHAALAGLALALLVLLSQRVDAWRLAAFSGLGFLVLYAAELTLWKVLDADAPTFWNTEIAWGYYFLGFPAEELAWAGLYGAVWATAMAYGASVHLRPKLVSQRNSIRAKDR
jgi:hypothetical protein